MASMDLDNADESELQLSPYEELSHLIHNDLDNGQNISIIVIAISFI